jgi:hypothetical protein
MTDHSCDRKQLRETALKRLSAALALTCALVLASSASAVEFGSNDDTGKFTGDSAFFAKMAGVGLKNNVMTVRWVPSQPTTIQDKAFLDVAVPRAIANGIKVILAVYPYPPREIEAGGVSPDAFGAYAAQLARTYPQVRSYIVGNEANQPAFWRPQFVNGQQASAAAFGPFLAAGYDGLKSVDAGIEVLGVGLSPRGNDRPDAPSNISTSPVKFLKALGDWYRASGRSKPLMDGFSFHPYPNEHTDALDKGYVFPNIGFPNLDRLKLALYDAFHGTAQPTAPKLFLDETGWQVTIPDDKKGRYAGGENISVTSEQTQASIYAELIKRAACDPAIAALNFFGFYDEENLSGWQAALHYADGTARPSAAAVQAAIAANSTCAGQQVSWSPTSGVVGADAEFGDLSTPKTKTQKAWAFNATALEDATYKAGVFEASTAKAQITRDLASVQAATLTTEGTVKANFSPRIQFPSVPLAEGTYRYAIRMAAWANGGRSTVLVSEPFTVGSGEAAVTYSVTGPLTLLANSASFLKLLSTLRSINQIFIQCDSSCSVESSVDAADVIVRATESVSAKPKPKRSARATLKLKAGQKGKLRFQLKGLAAGNYTLTTTVKSGARKVTVKTKPFYMSTSGKVSKAKPAKSKAKPAKKGKK